MSLVPYGGVLRAASRTVPWQYHVAAGLYNNRKLIKAAGSGAYRMGRGAWRMASRKRRRSKARAFSAKRRKIGYRVGASTAKRCQVREVNPTAYSTRSLEDLGEITALAKTATNEIDSRQRDIVNLRGFKICSEFRNNRETPLLVNYAVVCPKQNAGVSSTNWFRGMGTTRDTNFGTALSSNELHCLPINSDAYIVLMHKRFTLAPVQEDGPTYVYGQHMGQSWRSFARYIKMKRQIRYDNNGTYSFSSCYLVMWCDEFMTTGGSAAIASALTSSHRVVAYFREPKA